MEPQIVKAMLIYANASAMQYCKCIINGKLDFKWPNHGDLCKYFKNISRLEIYRTVIRLTCSLAN